ncbi:hypothetical protein [Clostridium tyrobutyricum]|uniref:hypothetical protein n=1 Tax=Clostridium tyrobutyricum TaxID=1519 RepID=UPI001C3DF378|nr:hypothetical protein [Clostridium tyrobutyricum]MBV4438583.1 hypothetical protein [Clostridium tyrobutyricum]
MSKPKIYINEEINEKVPQKIISYMTKTTKKISEDDNIKAIFGSTFGGQAIANVIFLADKLIYYPPGFSKTKILNYSDVIEATSKGKNKLDYVILKLKSDNTIKIDITTDHEEILKVLNYMSVNGIVSISENDKIQITQISNHKEDISTEKKINGEKKENIENNLDYHGKDKEDNENTKDKRSGFFASMKQKHALKKAEKEAKRAKEEAEALERKRVRNNMLATLREGNNMPRLDASSKINLQKNEECYYGCMAKRLVTKIETVGRTAGYKGVSIRITKGITYHTGGSRSHAIKDNVIHEYPGALFLTTKRVIFVSQAPGKSFTITFQKLLSTVNYKDGIGFKLESRDYTVTMDDPELLGSVLTGALKNFIK